VRNDDGSAWKGGFSPGTDNVIENSYCKLYCKETTVSGSGATLTVNWRMEFKPTMAGKTCGAWLYVKDDNSLSDGWDRLGTFSVGQSPVNVSISPSSGTYSTGSRYTFTSKASDTEGYANLGTLYLLINTAINSGKNAAYVVYDANTNKLYVRTDDNSGAIGGYAPGTDAVIENSYCKLYCRETTVIRSGDALTVNWRIEFKSTMAGKSCYAWQYIKDDYGLTDGWDQMGIFKIPDYAPTNVSLTPNNVNVLVGTRTTLTSVALDPNGYADLGMVYLLINTAINSGKNAPYVVYDANTNLLYVRKDDNSGAVGGYTPGSDNIIENSYCKLYCKETTVSASGNILTINWRIEFKPTMAGKNCYGWQYAKDDYGLTDGWDRLAAVTVR
jgi:hypothetical protein